MRVLKLTIAYDGTAYVGWQRQANGISIQQLIEEAFLPLSARPDGSPPTVVGAGRTDAGVHALGQVASVKVESQVPVDAIQRALNIRLPADIRVLGVVDEHDGFHARYDASGKSYRYRIVTTPVMSPFERLWAWHAPGRYDIDAMVVAARAFEGRHDFASLQTGGSPVSDTIRTMTSVRVAALDGVIVVDVAGDGFLRHMVRAMVGTLVEIGSGRRTAASVTEMLDGADRGLAGPTVPAQGLTLMDVRYSSASNRPM